MMSLAKHQTPRRSPRLSRSWIFCESRLGKELLESLPSSVRQSPVMKQVLLRVTCIRTEIIRRKRFQLAHRDVGASRKIDLAQDPGDPNVDRHGVQAVIREQQDAVSNLFPHPRQLAENGPRILGRKI